MNILAVSRYLPSPTWGGGIRTYYLLKALAKQHRVSLLAPEEGADPADGAALQSGYLTGDLLRFPSMPVGSKRLRQLTSILGGTPYSLVGQGVPGLRDAVRKLLEHERYDAVFFDSMFAADIPKEVRPRPDTLTIINQHNIEHELLARAAERERSPLRRLYYRREGYLLKPIELGRCRQADLVLVASERERDVLGGLLPDTRIAVVPNGVDTAAFQREPSRREVPNRLVFTGSMDYYPNVQAVLYFATHCWPLVRARVPSATWQIVGRNPPPAVERLAALPGVEVAGTVPDVRPYLAAAQVVIVPLLTGSGTRLKILEALAAGRAVVSTSIGCEGLATRAGEHLIVADEPEPFVSAVVALLRDAEARRTLGATGRALAEANYSWDRCGADLLTAIGRLSERRATYVSATGAEVAPHGS